MNYAHLCYREKGIKNYFLQESNSCSTLHQGISVGLRSFTYCRTDNAELTPGGKLHDHCHKISHELESGSRSFKQLHLPPIKIARLDQSPLRGKRLRDYPHWICIPVMAVNQPDSVMPAQ